MRKTKGKKRTALVASFYALMLMWSATTPALEHEEAGAQLAIGRMYERGIGVPQDYAKAVEWYRRAAEQGLARAQYNLGRMYDYGRGVTQDYAKAVKWNRRAAEQEFAGAQNDLGFMYEQGLGVPQDYAKAVEWYRRAADQGGARAQNNLGAMYQQGRGVPQDDAKAVDWYRRAADQGDGFAQLNLGFIYDKGLGVRRNKVLAHMWLNLAASSRHATPEQRDAARKSRDNLILMSSREIAEAQRMARQWLEKHATEQSETVESYRRAAEQGDAKAQYDLGVSYAQGVGAPQDYVFGYMWLNLAASSSEEMSPETRRNMQDARDKTRNKMTPAQVAGAQRMARQWLEKRTKQ